MANISAEIEQVRSELAKVQDRAKFFGSEYKKYSTEKSDLAQPYKIMTRFALERARALKRHIKALQDFQKRIDELDLKLAKLTGK